MPEVLTFDSLKADVRRYIERGNTSDPDVYAQIPRLINQAERNIAIEAKLQGFIRVVNGDMQAGVAVYAKPDRWRETVSMYYGEGTGQERKPLFARAYEYCRAYWPTATLTAAPLFYADYNYANWLISPTPDRAYPWEIVYYEMPALLDDTNQSNWLTDYSPSLLLYKTLMEAAPFLGEDQRIAVWQAQYEALLGKMMNQDLKRIIDRNSARRSP